MMKLHRIFIAINLPEGIKTKLLEYRNKWPELPARWTTKENLHLTLAFLGNTSDRELAEVCALLKRAGERHSPFSLAFTKIAYGPDAKRPQMIWAIGEKSAELLALQKDVASTLERTGQPFSPHLTLARLKSFEFQRIEPEEIPEINEEISLSFDVKSLEVMESRLRRSGSEYTILQSFVLQSK